jgi:hypothetical protein
MNSKKIDFHINQKVLTVDIGFDENNVIEDGIKKIIDLNKNLSTSDILLAFIKKTYTLVELEQSLEQLSKDIANIK